MQTNADYLLDTSAAIALISPDHPSHTEVKALCRGLMLGLSGHALIETYSVLTRLPGAQRLDRTAAATFLTREFPRSVALSSQDSLSAATIFCAADIAGGAVYDGLVGLAAKSAGITLISCDRRAAPTYAKLGVDVRLI